MSLPTPPPGGFPVNRPTSGGLPRPTPKSTGSSEPPQRTPRPKRKAEQPSQGSPKPRRRPKEGSMGSSTANQEQARTKRPRKVQQSSQQQQTPVDENGYATDPKTGVKYKPLPKTEWTEGGYSVIHVHEDMPDALNDLNAAADVFLSHLRIAPSKEEMDRLRKEQAMRARKMRAKYDAANPEEDVDDEFDL